MFYYLIIRNFVAYHLYIPTANNIKLYRFSLKFCIFV